MPFTTLFCDLDDTLYPPTSGLWDVIGERITVFMAERLKLPQEEICILRERYYHAYGSTLRGLQEHHGVDDRDYLTYVHDVPLADFISPEPNLRQMLLQYPQRRVIFTNADRYHATRVLNVLQLTDCFEQIIDIYATTPYCKPQPEAYRIALEQAGGLDPRSCVLVDDKLINLAVARELGFYTIWVGGDNGTNPDCHASIACIAELPAVLDPKLERWG